MFAYTPTARKLNVHFGYWDLAGMYALRVERPQLRYSIGSELLNEVHLQ